MMRGFGSIVAVALLAGCAADARDEGPGSEGALEQTCAEGDKALFFHGLSGYGRELARPGICVPRISDFSATSIAFMSARDAKVAAGYSAGRLPLIKRLANDRAPEKTALLLDPSWADGRRFDGKTGPEIVRAWLEADAERRFVIVYSPSSAGWREYVALTDSPVADRVRTCKVEGEHLDMPRLVGPELLTDTDGWLASRCR